MRCLCGFSSFLLIINLAIPCSGSLCMHMIFVCPGTCGPVFCACGLHARVRSHACTSALAPITRAAIFPTHCSLIMNSKSGTQGYHSPMLPPRGPGRIGTSSCRPGLVRACFCTASTRALGRGGGGSKGLGTSSRPQGVCGRGQGPRCLSGVETRWVRPDVANAGEARDEGRARAGVLEFGGR